MPSFAAVAVVPQLSLARARAAAWRRATRRKRPPQSRPGLSVSRRILELLIDRVESAVETGRLELVEDAGDVALAYGPAIHTAAYGELLAVLFEEEYRANPAPVTPTATAPKTSARLAIYAARRQAGQPIRSRLDTVPGRDEKLALSGAANRNGSGVRITGWSHDAAEEEIEPEELLSAGDVRELARRRGKRR